MDIIGLLESKNRCLEKYLRASKDFLEAPQDDELSGIDALHKKRDAILKTLELYDRKISELVVHVTSEDRTPELSDRVRAALERKEVLVAEILKTDALLVDLIEDAKLKITAEIGRSRKSKAVLSKFKSTWVPESGEGLDEKL